MERYSDVLNSIKERVTNPFLVSFAIFWCTYNWRIPIALLFWDMNQIYASGSTSIFEFIQKELAVEGSFSAPLKYAILYSVLAPFVFSLISIIGAWAIWIGNTLIFKSSTTTPINFDKFMELKKKHKETTDDYAKLLTTESETQKQLDLKSKELNEALERNTDIQKEHERALLNLKESNANTVQALRDELVKESQKYSGEIAANLDKIKNDTEEEKIRIQNQIRDLMDTSIIHGLWINIRKNEIIEITSSGIDNGTNIFPLLNFLNEDAGDMRAVSFTIVRDSGDSKDKKAEYYSLRLSKDSNRLSGIINMTTKIVYERTQLGLGTPLPQG